MNKSDLEKIIAIAEEGSMVKASQRLYISQPALSKCLSRVEAELGEVLFVRRPKGVEPTYALPRFLKYARQVIHMYDLMSVEFCEINEMRSGELKFGCSERMGAHVIPGALRAFRDIYPNISIKIVEANSDDLEDGVSSGKLDLAVILLPAKNPNLGCYVFHRGPCYIAVPTGHPLCEKGYCKDGEEMPYLDVGLLKGEDFVLTTPKKKTRQVVDGLLETFCGDYRVVLESNNIETVIRLVACGHGVSVVPRLFARIYSEEGRIQYFQMEERDRLHLEWGLIYAGEFGALTRPSREFFRLLCETFGSADADPNPPYEK